MCIYIYIYTCISIIVMCISIYSMRTLVYSTMSRGAREGLARLPRRPAGGPFVKCIVTTYYYDINKLLISLAILACSLL